METADGNNLNSPLIIAAAAAAGGSSTCRGDHCQWGTIFVVYALISLQLLLAASFGTNVVLNSGSIPQLELHTTQGLAICIISFVLWLVVQCPLLAFSNHYPLNFLFFTLWSTLFAFIVGLSCSYFEGNGTTILEAIILASAVTVTLTIYALCGSVGDFQFSLCRPCILCSFCVVCLYVTKQIFFHGSEILSTSIYGFLAALLLCGHTYIAGNQIVQQYDIVESPFSSVVYCYWTFLYYLKPAYN